MKNSESIILQKLKQLVKEHFQVIKSNSKTINNLNINGYQDLLFSLGALINICIMALDNKDFSNSPSVIEPEVHIKAVLELAIKLIPFEEGEFLDKISELVQEEKN